MPGPDVVMQTKRKTAEKKSRISTGTFLWIGMTVLSLIPMIVFLVADHKDSRHTWVLVVSILMFLSSLISYNIKSMLNAKHSEDNVRQALDAEMRQFEIFSERDEDLRRFRHDYANHIRAISAMIEDGQADNVKSYVETLGVDLQNTAHDFYTGNYMLDVILAEKRSVANQDGNDILFEGSFPKNGISNSDICTIMANALDNAVEACREIDRRCEITVRSIVKEDEVAVSITNPTRGPVRIVAGSVATSKSDNRMHGYGLKSIKKTVEKYNGSMQLSAEHQTFALVFNLKMIQRSSATQQPAASQSADG